MLNLAGVVLFIENSYSNSSENFNRLSIELSVESTKSSKADWNDLLSLKVVFFNKNKLVVSRILVSEMDAPILVVLISWSESNRLLFFNHLCLKVLVTFRLSLIVHKNFSTNSLT
ncbi:MAG: hypothetical protein CBC09_06350 [Cellvibrionales bacterium TMED49]|nr:MAG: hypothetical protein CBC09_06350 [Cellvibrionales bacterium TMED49]